MTTEQRIAVLEARLDALAEANSTVTHQLAKAHVDQWQARIDELELQVHLGRLEATDHVSSLTNELQSRWSKVRRQLQDASDTTTGVAETLQNGLDNAYQELRTALIDSRKQLNPPPG